MPYPYYPPFQNPYQMFQAPQVGYTPTTQNSIIWVSGEREALAYPVAPNNAVTLWSQTEPVVYLKQADASGKPSMKIYDLVERQESVSERADKEPAYATKSELAAFNSALADLKDDVEKLRAELPKKRTMKREDEDA